MEQWYPRVWLDGEIPVGSGEIPALGHSVEFLQESELGIVAANVLYDRIGIGDVELVIGKWEYSAIGDNRSDARVISWEMVEAF